MRFKKGGEEEGRWEQKKVLKSWREKETENGWEGIKEGGGGSTESGGEILARSQSARVVRAVSLQEEEQETQGLPVRHSQTPERASERASGLTNSTASLVTC